MRQQKVGMNETAKKVGMNETAKRTMNENAKG
jgi:hypothetical protein